MSSVGSVIAQRPYRAKNFSVFNNGAYMFPTTSVETAAPANASQVVGSVITFPSLAFATPAVATANTLLTGGALMSAGLTINGVATGAILAGQQLLDMGRYVTVYVTSEKVYTLALVQLKRDASATTEGISGSYATFYVVIETNLPAGANPGTDGVGLVGVARV